MTTDQRVNGWYLAVFTPLMIVGTVAAAFGAWAEGGGWQPTVLTFFNLVAPVAVGSTGLSFFAVQVGGLVVFWLETALKKRDAERAALRAAAIAEGRAEGRVEGRAEGHAEGRMEGHAEGRMEGHAEGRAEVYAAIAEWDARRKAAEAQGKEFTEPPPHSNSAGS